MHFRKKILNNKAVQQTTSGTLNTLEGPLTFNPGDWIITGIKGERYAVPNEKFIKLYDKVEGEQDIYRKKPGYIDAIELRHPLDLVRSDGVMHGKVGDFLADNGESQYIIDGDVMKLSYERV